MTRLDVRGRRVSARPLDAVVVGVGDWRAQAACAAMDPVEADRVFFPVTPKNGRRSGSRRHLLEARSICGKCPVRAECAAYALGNDEQFGVWGGLDEDERRQLARRTRSE